VRSQQAAGPEAETPLRATYTSPPPTLFLGGEIDESTYRDLLRVLELAVATKRHLLRVDMADVMYCDLAGLRAIVSLAHAGKPGSTSVDQLVLQHLPIQLRTVVRILGWDATPGLFLAEPAC
jgi:ABC-type transporter Mla MlaB component